MLTNSEIPANAATAAVTSSTRDATPTDLGGEGAAQMPQLGSEVKLQNGQDIIMPQNLNPADVPALPSANPSKSQSIAQEAPNDQSALESDSCMGQQSQQSEKSEDQGSSDR